jgi:DNA invertase Pin-like site-specific DNA recombinase
MHRCDNRRCCEPSHLRLGTVADNSRDMVEKGRSRLCGRPGERNSYAKLTAEQAQEIRHRHLAGETQTALAREFGVHSSTVSCMVRGATWRAG